MKESRRTILRRGLLASPFLAIGCREKEKSAAIPKEGVDLLGESSPVDWEAAGIEGEGFFVWEKSEGSLRIEAGELLGGVRAFVPDALSLPKRNYTLSVSARRVEGTDIFCGLTFPVLEDHLSLIAGGWGGTVVGLSSIDHLDASENSTRTTVDFENGRWYDFVIEVGEDWIRVRIDDHPVVRISLRGRVIGLKPGSIENCLPLGLATWRTTAELRDLVLKRGVEAGW